MTQPDNYNGFTSLVSMLQSAWSSSPTATAMVSDDGTSLTMAQMQQVCVNLANQLVDGFGMDRGSIGGIYLDKSTEYVLAYASVLLAGGAYMPLDVSYPQLLLKSVVEESKPKVIFTKPALLDRLRESYDGPVLVLDVDSVSNILNTEATPLRSNTVGLDDLAYVVYSSGTTGKPKGICCPHRGAVFSYLSRCKDYPYAADDKEACNVFFVWELLRPILSGVPLYIIPDDVIYDPSRLCEYIARHGITRMLFTPSLLVAVWDTTPSDVLRNKMRTMRTILLNGEVVTRWLLERVTSVLPEVQVVNVYSISECHDVATIDLTKWLKCSKGQTKYCPAGRLVPGVLSRIVDDSSNTVPIGVSGEICIGGPTLALEYLERPELNAKKFFSVDGIRFYHTGDWGYVLADGSLEICGRCDSMVKVRGYSVELPAVEAAITNSEMVTSCAVSVVGAEGEEKLLVGYVVPASQGVTRRGLRQYLKHHLPFYMIPRYFVFLDKLPVVAATGKIDMKALPQVVSAADAVEPEAQAQSQTEIVLSRIWAKVLELPAVDVQETFFDLGGHSLLAVTLLNMIKEEMGADLQMRDFLMAPTIRTVARTIDGDADASLERPKIDLMEEAEKHMPKNLVADISLRAFWRSLRWGDRWNKGCVLLTGVTGFLGGFLLAELIQNTQTRVVCIARAPDQTSAEQRIISSMKKSGLWHGTVCDVFADRVTVLKGDISLSLLGLSEDDYTYLSYDVDVVIHCAAYVNLIYPYQALYSTNVLGTQNVLLFCYANKIKPIHHVSTSGVAREGCTDLDESSSVFNDPTGINDGYGQSKWVAEKMVRGAGQMGLPYVIYRLGNQGGHSKLGSWNLDDQTYLMIFACAYLNAAPEVDWHIELTPVDFTAFFIVEVATKAFTTKVGKVFNLVNEHLVSFRSIIDWLNAIGYDISLVPYNQWISKLKRCASEKATSEAEAVEQISRLSQFLDENSTSGINQSTTFRHSNVDTVLADLGVEYPKLNRNLLRVYIDQLVAHDLMPLPKTMKPLERKICFVTGATSGIGEAIARKLAIDGGAKVAIAGRRLDRLEGIAKDLTTKGCTVLALPCDITNAEEVKTSVAKVTAEWGRIDLLVNNAGVMYVTLMKNTLVDQWRQQIDVNCQGTMNVIGAVLPGMTERKSGHIVTITSDAGKRAFAGMAVYSGTKFFLEGMLTALRQEVVDLGIRVTNVQPGDVDTGLYGMSTDTEALAMCADALKKEMLTPEDVAGAVFYAATQPDRCAVNEVLIEPRLSPV